MLFLIHWMQKEIRKLGGSSPASFNTGASPYYLAFLRLKYKALLNKTVPSAGTSSDSPSDGEWTDPDGNVWTDPDGNPATIP